MLSLLLFWSKMRRQQLVLVAQEGEVEDNETTMNNASLDKFIPTDAELRRYFTYGFVVCTFGIRIVMLSATGVLVECVGGDDLRLEDRALCAAGPVRLV